MRPKKPRNTATGERNGNSTLTPTKLARAKRLHAERWNWIEIADVLGCTESTVRRAVKGQTWKHAA